MADVPEWLHDKRFSWRIALVALGVALVLAVPWLVEDLFTNVAGQVLTEQGSPDGTWQVRGIQGGRENISPDSTIFQARPAGTSAGPWRQVFNGARSADFTWRDGHTILMTAPARPLDVAAAWRAAASWFTTLGHILLIVGLVVASCGLLAALLVPALYRIRA